MEAATVVLLSSFLLSSKISRKQHRLHLLVRSRPTLCRNHNRQCSSRLRDSSKFQKKKRLELDQMQSSCKMMWRGNSPADGRLHLPEKKLYFFYQLWTKIILLYLHQIRVKPFFTKQTPKSQSYNDQHRRQWIKRSAVRIPPHQKKNSLPGPIDLKV